MGPVSSDTPAGGRPARWTAAAGVALILAVSVAAWWVVGPQPYEAPPKPATMAERVGGVVAVVVAVAAAVALVAAARAGRMDLRWRPTVVALSLAGVLSGAGVRFWKDDWLGINLFFIGPLWLILVVYGLLRIPPYDPPPRG
ncbi:MAG TPA: hypothetical protein VFA46_22150 [Actinomycetes bacterium]|jgi:type IV secretory pathway VirB2 component (pilin)|nr:hypothetical protein [Actinomycetes bacterium]